MGIEIERKFLLADERWRKLVTRSQPMKQGYLAAEAGVIDKTLMSPALAHGASGGKASTRVRVEGSVANLNIKAAVTGSRRAEYQYEIPLHEARELLATLCVGVVEKIRHYVEMGSLTWEIDEFEGANAGLIVAEIELKRVDQAFERPAWLGREVTDDARYYNHHLALHPYSSWTK